MDKGKQKPQVFARGGDTPMFRQQAASTQRPGQSGKPDQHGPGGRAARGGVMPMRRAASTAVPASSGKTGNPREPIGRRSVTRDYRKSRP
jgi:hypothetical protein